MADPESKVLCGACQQPIVKFVNYKDEPGRTAVVHAWNMMDICSFNRRADDPGNQLVVPEGTVLVAEVW